ncbi:DUF4198 domain-containing protein [Hoeflea alexandrii]|jgi:uncharacterized GH25 family protein|uniref:DUF4198 domain-containing protein n=1 Tax=Hoeflea alexandrii TaxID=288436 RepID=A0ABT1CN46_9HYPH|nr:DUF4198 domain-containing protein [Hoeflea alexandrii]MCO6407614.1 DUF4198 domain-containing protein [Hoeflea alexandrii]
MERPARRSPYLGTASALIGAILAASPVSAHEFWIEPADFSIEAGATIEADLRVGQDFTGDAFPYIPSRFAAFERHDRLGAADVEGVTGDLPALSLLPRTEGLSIFTYVSAGERIRFRQWDKFQFYLDYEGLDKIAAVHDARGLPRDDIREIYTRCAKTLVAVGDAEADQDRAIGMRLELVAADTPSKLVPGAEISFTLLWEGGALPDTQVALFYKKGTADEATRTLTRTDGNGRASFTLPASGSYMAASVHMIEAAPDRNADWQSYWASLTFGVE